jgi:hypothetical protein
LSNDVETAVQSWIAETQMRSWAKAPDMGHEPRRVDIEAEYSLRSLKPPYELVRAEIEAITQVTAGAIEDMDEVDRERIDNEILNLRSGEKA